MWYVCLLEEGREGGREERYVGGWVEEKATIALCVSELSRYLYIAS